MLIIKYVNSATSKPDNLRRQKDNLSRQRRCTKTSATVVFNAQTKIGSKAPGWVRHQDGQTDLPSTVK